MGYERHEPGASNDSVAQSRRVETPRREAVAAGPPLQPRTPLRLFRILRDWWREHQTSLALGALDDAILKDIGVCRCEIDWIAREQFADRPRARDEEQVVLSAWIAGRKPAAGSMIVEPGIDRCSAGLP